MSALNTKSGLNRLFPFAKKKPNIPFKQSDKVDTKSNKQKLNDDNSTYINKTSEATRSDVLIEKNEKDKRVYDNSYSNETSKQSFSEVLHNDNLVVAPKTKKSVTRKLSNASVTSIEGTKKPKENYQRWNIPFSSKFKGQDFDKKLLTMQDLIYYNPVTNPIIKETNNEQHDDDDDPDNDLLPIQSEESDKKPSVSNCITPCIKVGADGKIVIDQETLTLNETGLEEKREELAKAKVIELSASQSRFNSYKCKNKSTKQWTKCETLKFYKCLMNLGTDFSMIEQYFPNRTRAQIKRKYKLEEKKNPELINSALSNTAQYDSVLIDDMLREDEPEVTVNADSKISMCIKKTENKMGSENSKNKKTKNNVDSVTQQKRTSKKRMHANIVRSQCSRISVCAFMMEEEHVQKKKRKIPKKNCTAYNLKDTFFSAKKKRGRPFKVEIPSDSDTTNIDEQEKEKLVPKVRTLQDFHEEYAETINKYNDDLNSE